jgi:hypothetical protein
MNNNLEDAETVADSRPTLDSEQYANLTRLYEIQGEIQKQGYPILKRKMELDAQAAQASATAAEVEKQLSQVTAEAQELFKACMTPYGLENAAVTISNTEPHYITVLDPATGQPLDPQPTIG